MLNSVCLIGRLTRDPELRKTPNGASVTNFTLAVNRRNKDDGADFIRCVAWNQTADFLCKYLNKGALISVEGRIETGSYQDTDGKIVYTTDIVANSIQALESQSQRQQNQQPHVQPQNEFKQEAEVNEFSINDDDLPF